MAAATSARVVKGHPATDSADAEDPAGVSGLLRGLIKRPVIGLRFGVVLLRPVVEFGPGENEQPWEPFRARCLRGAVFLDSMAPHRWVPIDEERLLLRRVDGAASRTRSELTFQAERGVTLCSMGSIKGYYEWDNEDLTPGQKKEGGLHQNLFDAEGNLKGSARFIPAEEEDSDELVITETVYVPMERRKSREQEEFEEAIAAIVAHLIERGFARAKPMVAQWYREKARPVVAAQRTKVSDLRSRRKARKVPETIEATVVESGQELVRGARAGASGHVRR